MKWLALGLWTLIIAALFYPIDRSFHFVDSVGGIFVGKIRVNLASQILTDTGLSDFKFDNYVMRVEHE